MDRRSYVTPALIDTALYVVYNSLKQNSKNTQREGLMTNNTADYKEKYKKYIEIAQQMGATDAVPFRLSDICFDSRTLLKCMFGCPDWGKNHTCPSRPGSPTMNEYREMFSRYSGGVIIHTHDKRTSQRISFEIEKEAFLDGYYFAISLSDCSLCSTCAAVTGKPCRNPRMARPAFHSVGIDVFKTVHQLGLPLRTLSRPDEEEQNWYSAVFID